MIVYAQGERHVDCRVALRVSVIWILLNRSVSCRHNRIDFHAQANLRKVRKMLLYAPGNDKGLAIMKEILTKLQLPHERVKSIQEKEKEGKVVSAHHWTLMPMMEGDLESSDLGAKLEDALNRVRSSDGGKSGVAFLGMDSPILSLGDIALGLLNAKTVPPTAMLCPADDGGYGMLCVPPNADASKTFYNMYWSHALTALSQIKTLTDQGIMVKIGKCMHDIDEPSDVQALSHRLSGATSEQGNIMNLHQNSGGLATHTMSQHPSCQHTREFLKAAGLLQ